MEQVNVLRIEQVLEHQFKDHNLVRQAVTHASLVDSRLHSNERLEFLGDSVLGLVVCSHLFQQFPDLLEGEMTKIKSTVVSRKVCAEIATALGLHELLQMGKGMTKVKALPGSVLAAVFESLVGALYLDGGFEPAREFILKLMRPRIEA